MRDTHGFKIGRFDTKIWRNHVIVTKISWPSRNGYSAVPVANYPDNTDRFVTDLFTPGAGEVTFASEMTALKQLRIQRLLGRQFCISVQHDLGLQN